MLHVVGEDLASSRRLRVAADNPDPPAETRGGAGAEPFRERRQRGPLVARGIEALEQVERPSGVADHARGDVDLPAELRRRRVAPTVQHPGCERPAGTRGRTVSRRPRSASGAHEHDRTGGDQSRDDLHSAPWLRLRGIPQEHLDASAARPDVRASSADRESGRRRATLANRDPAGWSRPPRQGPPRRSCRGS